MADLSYFLILNIPGIDWSEIWKTLKDQQKVDVLDQVTKHVHSFINLKSEQIQSANSTWSISLTFLQPGLSLKDNLLSKLLNLDESQTYNIWSVEQTKFIPHHNKLRPMKIQIIINKDGKANVTGLLDWENARYLLTGGISTDNCISSELCFDWDDRKDKNKWLARLKAL